jgi:hypothetical protein
MQWQGEDGLPACFASLLLPTERKDRFIETSVHGQEVNVGVGRCVENTVILRFVADSLPVMTGISA